MLVYISHSHKDKDAANRIASRLREGGHNVWIDAASIKPGDNISQKVQEGLEQADALIVIVSENSRQSKWVQYEFSAIAFQQISKSERRIIPVRIDHSDIPSYLSDILYIDFSQDFEFGLKSLIEALKTFTPDKDVSVTQKNTYSAENRAVQTLKLREALRRGRLTLVCGAGVSLEAGIPIWRNLLIQLLRSMVERISKDISLDQADDPNLEFNELLETSPLILGKYLKNNLGSDFAVSLRDTLYKSNPSKSPMIDSIVELARPQRNGNSLDSIITFNFDSLIEENMSSARVENKSIFSEATKHEPYQIPIYHVHGYLPRADPLPDEGLVFSEDAYHNQFIDPFSWSNLIQLNKLTHNTCLFIGISLTDPNMRRLLDVAWRKSPEKTLAHYIVKKLPKSSDNELMSRISKFLEEQDANELGLNVIWINEFSDLPDFIKNIADQKQ